MQRLTAILTALILLSAAAATASAGPYDVDQYRQEGISDLNRARWSPEAYSPDLAGVASRPPLAVNDALMGSSQQKAGNIVVYDCTFGTQNPAHQCPWGTYPDELAADVWGYPLPGNNHEANTIEAYYAGAFAPVWAFASEAAAEVHRPVAFIYTDRIEIGVGLAFDDDPQGTPHWIFHIGYRSQPVTFLTGTVFDDRNGNGWMDHGEGLEGVTVTVPGVGSATSNAGGGYSIQVPPGNHTVTASGGGFWPTASSAPFNVTQYNVGADFVLGDPEAIVRPYELCAGLEPTILGTDGDDVIYGTLGDDVIHGLGGNDVIHGWSGDDVICGGWGHDLIRGNPGDDLILGQAGDDDLSGDRGDDRIRGAGGDDVVDGGGDNDVLLGQDGNDVLLGSFGRDVLDGGSGAYYDWLNGGHRSDRCYYGEDNLYCEVIAP